MNARSNSGKQAGSAAADAARVAFAGSMASGHNSLAALFLAVDAEGHERMLSHMPVRAALEALPAIDECQAGAILDRLLIAHDEHLDLLSGRQRKALCDAVEPTGTTAPAPRSFARVRGSGRTARR